MRQSPVGSQLTPQPEEPAQGRNRGRQSRPNFGPPPGGNAVQYEAIDLPAKNPKRFSLARLTLGFCLVLAVALLVARVCPFKPREIDIESILGACSRHFRAGPDLPGKTNSLRAFVGTSAKVFQISWGTSRPNCSSFSERPPLQPQDALVWVTWWNMPTTASRQGIPTRRCGSPPCLPRMGKESQVRIETTTPLPTCATLRRS